MFWWSHSRRFPAAKGRFDIYIRGGRVELQNTRFGLLEKMSLNSHRPSKNRSHQALRHTVAKGDCLAPIFGPLHDEHWPEGFLLHKFMAGLIAAEDYGRQICAFSHEGFRIILFPVRRQYDLCGGAGTLNRRGDSLA
jgi:hypothetical protein